MNLMKPTSAIGAGVTTFLIVGTATIEAATAAVGGDIGPGIVGVVVGALAGLVVAAVVGRSWDRLAGRARTGLVAYAAFGLTIVFLAFLSYVDVPGVDAYLGLERNLVIGLVVALAAAVAAWRRDRPAPSGATER